MSSEEQPWYSNGLQFTCSMCGHCCSKAEGYVWVSEEELTLLADYLKEPLLEVKAMYTIWTTKGYRLREKGDGSCVFYADKEGCTVYPARPLQCQSWPFWHRNVDTPKQWEETSTLRGCKGAGQGELIPLEEIKLRLKMVDL